MSFKRRKDLVFGLHFDFHANLDSPNIGENFTEEMVQTIIDTVHPDFIQCDCKGHPGISSYPTKVGNPAPKIKKDILKIWREVTAKNGIPLFVHYSGLFDAEVLKHNPQWQLVENDGTINENAVNLFCDYPEKIMIPQLLELAGDYKIDGVWVDGDCWGVLRDSGENMKKYFEEKTGIKKFPQKYGDEGFLEYLECLRELYRKYLDNYTNEVHKKFPNFQIASNWAYSTFMPEKVEADVDFLSGDVFGNDMINRISYEAKYLAQQGKPWDLMPWNVSTIVEDPNDPTGGKGTHKAYKTALQLKQEASQILAHGGGVQIYYAQEKDGSLDVEKIKSSIGLYDFCNDRKPYCFRGKQKSEIAVYFSKQSSYELAIEAFGFLDGNIDFLKGDVSLVSSTGLPIDLISEHHFGNIGQYSLLIIPEWEKVYNKDELLDFVNRGGNILILGSKSIKDWQDELSVKVNEILNDCNFKIFKDEGLNYLETSSNIALIDSVNADIISYFEVQKDDTLIHTPLLAVNDYGKGKIAGLCLDTGMIYKSFKDTLLSDLIREVIDLLIPEKFVDIIGSRYIASTVYEVDEKLCVGLMNVAGPHSDPSVLVYDEIPIISGITVKVKCDKPKKIYREPLHIEMPFTYENGIAETYVDNLEIFDILVFKK